MKVTADATLFGAWVARQGRALPPTARVLDIGTGTGLLALMFAQLNPGCPIDAVELEPAAAGQAAENVAASPWAEQIRVLAQSVQSLAPVLTYDLVMCNPPFFHQSLLAPAAGRSLARHSGVGLPPDELRAVLAQRLKPMGQAWLLLPAQDADRWAEPAAGLWPQTKVWFGHRPGQPPHRLILGLARELGPGHQAVYTTHTAQDQPSDWAHELTAAFYLPR
jgi:tRNA1Val (adenine37-N6)-methyltransferase